MKQGWEIKKLSQLFDVKSSRRVHQADWKSTGIPFYRAREVVKLARDGMVENELFISQELYDEFTKEKGAPKTGDIIVSAVGTLGQCYLVKDSDKFYFKDASVLWFENMGKVNSRYIEYAFKADSIMAQVMDGSMGATVGTLTISRAKEIEIPLPPLPEQKRIVAILDEVFAAMDKAKAIAEINLKNTKELFESYLQGVFENKGQGWVHATIGETCDLQTGGTPSTSKKEFYEGGNIKWLVSGDINQKVIYDCEGRITELGMRSSNTKYLPINSVLIALNGQGKTRGTVAMLRTKATCNQSLVSIFPKDEKLLMPELVYSNLEGRYDEIRKMTGDSGNDRRGLNMPLIRSIKFSYPKKLSEQKEIINRLDNLRVETKKLEEIYNQKINDLEELKKSMLQKAFNGELNTERKNTHEKATSL